MLLGNLLKSTGKKYQKIPIKGIAFDSRKLKKQDIFFAIKGSRTSGTKFINEAKLRGAAAIVCEKNIQDKNLKIPTILVKDVRKSLAEACSNFYKKKPSNIIAVTGTNGKSSVADFFYQILAFNKIPAASIGTLGIISKKYRKKTNLTSADPLSLHKNLEILSKKNIKHVILEASSHGLKQKRLDNINFKIGIFTNLSHDHLDYHKNMKSYLNSKMHLFKNILNKNSKIIADEDIKEFQTINSIGIKRKIKQITIGKNSKNLKILKNAYKNSKQIVKISLNSKIFNLEIPLIGYFQIKNLLMASIAAAHFGINQRKIFNQIKKIKPVPGRLECIANLKNNSNIIVDFAHTPDALKQSLLAIKKQFNKEISIVFGCGGERDKQKRLTMGKIAKKYCKKIYITDDNPRNENPEKIRKVIARGCGKLSVDIGSREEAIDTAIRELGPSQILLIAGKGHEQIQDYGNKIINFSDKKIIKKIIRKRKFYLRKNSYQNYLLSKTFQNNIKDINYNGVSINTKNVKKNNLFFAIRGKKTDGHLFVRDAIKKGAKKVIISKKIKNISSNKFIKVKNTLQSLNKLANNTREITNAKIIAITGSVGKTTLKNLISFGLKNYGKVYCSPHSYNNKFGVPLSISNLKKDTQYGVFEIGMDKKGEIKNLSKIVKPKTAVITNIAGAHFKNFKTLKDIARAKGEIIENIQKDGNLILNKDGNFFKFFLNLAKKKEVKVLTFGLKKKADIHLLKVKKIKKLYKLKIKVRSKIYYFTTPYSTNNFITNFLACIATLYLLDLNLNIMKNKFLGFKIPSGRGDIQTLKKFNKKFKFIDESYNANPLSMESAIKNMSYYKRKKRGKKLVLLGDMLELGKKSKKFHMELSKIVNKSDVDKVFVYGKYIRDTFKYLGSKKKGKIFSNLTEARLHLSKILHNNDILMVKGSNATGLSQFSKNIKRSKISVI